MNDTYVSDEESETEQEDKIAILQVNSNSFSLIGNRMRSKHL